MPRSGARHRGEAVGWEGLKLPGCPRKEVPDRPRKEVPCRKETVETKEREKNTSRKEERTACAPKFRGAPRPLLRSLRSLASGPGGWGRPPLPRFARQLRSSPPLEVPSGGGSGVVKRERGEAPPECGSSAGATQLHASARPVDLAGRKSSEVSFWRARVRRRRWSKTETAAPSSTTKRGRNA